ncbi:MAG: hypothetical protein HYV63_12170 [Candidatus Schekmanbacteria bacterium]|nr:hypothetical protein [Candidatus Schekmanbacteria bacterium]
MNALIEFVQFLKVNKKLWLGPLIFVAALVGLLLLLAPGSEVAPFTYAIF